MSFGKLGALGRGFGRLGASLGSPPDSDPPPEEAPEMQFDEATNSQLIALLEDI